MKKNILNLFAALAVAACAAPLDPTVPNITQNSDVLDVVDGVDSLGERFQHARIDLTTDRSVVGVVDGRASARLAMSLNGVRQSSIVYHGFVVGLGRIETREAFQSESAQFSRAPQHFWTANLGFADFGADRPQSFSVSGSLLTEGQRVAVQFSVCDETSCVDGPTRELIVHLVH